MTEAGFTDKVVRAAHAFVAAKGKDPVTEGAALAKYLRSDHPLGKEERDLLAELVTGSWRSEAKRPEVLPGQKQVVEVVAALREAVDAGIPKEAAKLEVANKFSISRGTVENYESMTIEREKMIEESRTHFTPETKT